jgi:hypothetical protein
VRLDAIGAWRLAGKFGQNGIAIFKNIQVGQDFKIRTSIEKKDIFRYSSLQIPVCTSNNT